MCSVLGAWPLKERPTKDPEKDPENCPGALGLSSLPLGFHQEENFLESVVYPRNLITLGTHKGKYRSVTKFSVLPTFDLKTYQADFHYMLIYSLRKKPYKLSIAA